MGSVTRVMHVTYDMRIGGTEQVIRNLLEGADSNRLEQSLFCIEEPLGPWGLELRDAGVRIVSINRRPGLDWRVVRELRKQLKADNIDVLHCHQYTPWTYGVAAALGTRASVVFTEHGRFFPDEARPKRRYINPLLCRRTHRITAISLATRQALADFEYIDQERVEVIYNGIVGLAHDEEAVRALKREYDIPEDAVVLGTIARLDPIKNHQMMIRAFRRVLDEHPDSRLLIVGDGEESKAILRQVEELDLKAHVVMPGYIAKPAVWLAAMDIYLLSSFSEGTSMTLLEALSLGKPCVVTDVGGNPEVVRHEESGLVVESDNEEAFAKACLTLLRDPTTLRRYGSLGRQDFERRFHASIMRDHYASLYGELA